MAVLAVFTVRGDTDELLARYDKLMAELPGRTPTHPLAHAAIPAAEGMRVYDVWESEAALGDFAQNPVFRQLLAEVGLPEPEVDVRPVHRFGW
jgi:hypothetical protein